MYLRKQNNKQIESKTQEDLILDKLSNMVNKKEAIRSIGNIKEEIESDHGVKLSTK